MIHEVLELIPHLFFRKCRAPPTRWVLLENFACGTGAGVIFTSDRLLQRADPLLHLDPQRIAQLACDSPSAGLSYAVPQDLHTLAHRRGHKACAVYSHTSERYHLSRLSACTTTQ